MRPSLVSRADRKGGMNVKRNAAALTCPNPRGSSPPTQLPMGLLTRESRQGLTSAGLLPVPPPVFTLEANYGDGLHLPRGRGLRPRGQKQGPRGEWLEMGGRSWSREPSS